MEFNIEVPEKRSEVINCRVTGVNKEFVTLLSEKYDTSESSIVNQIIDQFRQVTDDSNKGKPRRGS